jgi:hypothetical protein
MLVVPPHFDKDDTSLTRTFSVIFTDFGNSPVRLHRCHGRVAFCDFLPTGYSLVVPFHESDVQYDTTLIHDLMLAMPYYCWPCPALSSRQVVRLMEPSFADRPLPAMTYAGPDPTTNKPLACGGTSNVC